MQQGAGIGFVKKTNARDLYSRRTDAQTRRGRQKKFERPVDGDLLFEGFLQN